MNFIEVFKDAMPLLSQGFGMSIGITVLSLVLAAVIGIFACLFTISGIKPLKWIATIYIWIIRGTPMLVQAMYIYFALPALVKGITGERFVISVFTASLLTLTLNAGAYMSEIFRGAIESVNRGQMEAARSLGLGYAMAMRKVILPQAVRICLPSLVNQCIITFKDSTILYAIGLAEVMYYAKIYVGRTMQSLATYTIIAVFFLIITSILMVVSNRIERRLKK